MNKVKNIVVFTSAIDLDNPLLAHTWNWIFELSQVTEKVFCCAIHLGGLPEVIPKNVQLIEIGGGSIKQRSLGVYRLLNIFRWVKSLNNASTHIFYHMIKEPGLILAPLFRSFGFNQTLWYSHNHGGLSLRYLDLIVDRVLTPTQNSYPIIGSKKVRVVGHGIDSEIFHLERNRLNKGTRIFSVGRISQVKRIEDLLHSMRSLKSQQRKLELFGPVGDETYLGGLLEIAKRENVDLQYQGTIPYSEISKVFKSGGIYFMGSPKTLDKAAVQAAMCGCLVVSKDKEALNALGMNDLWRNFLGKEQIPDLVIQLEILCGLRQDEIIELQDYVANYASLRHSTSRLMEVLIEY